jgi:hypothetical protein
VRHEIRMAGHGRVSLGVFRCRAERSVIRRYRNGQSAGVGLRNQDCAKLSYSCFD